MKRFFFILSIIWPFLLSAQIHTISFPALDDGFYLVDREEDFFSFKVGIPSIGLQGTETSQGQFTSLLVPGTQKDFGLAGYPDLPVMTRLIELPEDAEVEIVVTSSYKHMVDMRSLGYPNPILPVQPSVSKADDPGTLPFIYHRLAYQTDAFSAQKLVSVEYLGRMRGVRVARITMAPFRYNPVKNILEVTYEFHVRISYPGADFAKTKALRQKYYSPYFEKSFRSLVNHSPESSLDLLTQYPVKYVIVSDPMFQAALQPFVAWKTRKGFKVIEAYTNDPLVGNTTTSIKNYLQTLYQNASPADPAPSFALLVGDVAQVPSFSGTTGSHPSDLYYFEYDGSGDYLPELYYGRFSANNLAELQPQIDKTLEYEQYLMPDPSFLQKVVMVAGVDNTFGYTHANGQVNYGTDNYFNAAHGLISSTYLYPASGNSSSQIINDISNGVGFANYTAHCGTNGWGDPSFTISNISSLENTSRYPLIIGNCCQSNKFDQTCFGEALLRAQNKGALGYIGGSNNTLWDEDFYWSVGVGTAMANPTYTATGLGAYDRLFHDHGEPRAEWYETNGQIIMAGNLAVSASTSTEKKYYWEIYHLMGDPSVMTYFGVPQALTVNHTPLLPLGTNTFQIITEPYAYAGISKNNILFGAGIADSLGQLTLNIMPFTSPGYADVVITKQNRKPYIDSVLVASPNGPFVLMDLIHISDNNGNNNGLADFGEFILLDVNLVNYGNALAGMVSASLHSTDTFISLIDTLEACGPIPSGDTLIKPGAFSFDVHPLIPDGHMVPFQLKITDTAGNIWTSQFFVKLHAPDLKIISMDIDDQTSGNGNGSIDPGELVEMRIKISNKGKCEALNAISAIVTYSPIALITNGNILIDTLKESQTIILTYIVQVSPTALVGDVFEVHCTLSSGWYADQMSFAPMVGRFKEDWETGSLTKYNWVSGGNQAWMITNTGAYEGLYAARSGIIGNVEESSLEINLNVLSQDSISFFRKVSSEANYDFLEFYIDNSLQAQWSGQMDWTRFSYPVSPGQRTFRWVYKKDWYLASGSDCAWIDYISFPAIAGIVTDREVDFKGISQVQVFPNPAYSHVYIQFFQEIASQINLSVSDASGRLLKRETYRLESTGTHTIEVDLSGYQAGVYHLMLFSEDNRISKKIVLMR